MASDIEKIADEPVVLARLHNSSDKRTITEHFTQIPALLGEINGPACLILDLQAADELDEKTLVDTLRVFNKMLPTIKADAPIFEAFLGKNDLVARICKSLEQSGVVIPAFNSNEEALSYLRLKVGSAHLTQSARGQNRYEVGDTLFVKRQGVPDVPDTKSLPKTGMFPQNGLLILKSEDSERVLSVRPDHDMLIGRRDSTHKAPDVDFSLWEGFDEGVSRRHAKLSLSWRNDLEITDLASANGTFINGKRIKPFMAYPLRDGDRLMIGKLVVRVYFESAQD